MLGTLRQQTLEEVLWTTKKATNVDSSDAIIGYTSEEEKLLIVLVLFALYRIKILSLLKVMLCSLCYNQTTIHYILTSVFQYK